MLKAQLCCCIYCLLLIGSFYPIDTDCALGVCGHPKARKWIQCIKCVKWYHCNCANVPYKKAAAEEFVFICNEC